MEKDSRITAFLIPGAYPEAAKNLFKAIKNELEITQYNTVELERADIEHLTEKCKQTKLKVLIGKSIGGKIAMDYQLKYQDAQVIVLLAPAIRVIVEYPNIEIPVLIIHGTKDETIPIKNSRNLKQKFKNSTFEEIIYADHGFKGKETEVSGVIVRWLATLNKLLE